MKVKYMLWLALKTHREEEVLDIEPGSTILDLMLKIREKRDSIAKYIDGILSGKSEIIVLHNSARPIHGLKTILKDGDIITLIPPVSGG